MDRSLGENFRLGRKIASGTFADVFMGTSMKTGEKVALKFVQQGDERASSSTASSSILQKEAKLYKHLAGGRGIPRFYWYGPSGDRQFLAMELLGPSLEDLLYLCRGKFSLKTVLMLADQMLETLEHVHELDYVHRDIKPDNFCVGRGDKANQIHLIDFQTAKRYRDGRTREHVPCEEGKVLVGTAKYVSVCAHRGFEQSRRDDLTSLGYVWVRLLNGALPWESPKAARTKAECHGMIEEMKVRTTAKDLCRGHPVEFATYFDYCWRLRFDEKPDYSYLRRLFKELLLRGGFAESLVFDWHQGIGQRSGSIGGSRGPTEHRATRSERR